MGTHALYADLARLAADAGDHHLAADMYVLAIKALGDNAPIGLYLRAANVERHKALEVSRG